MPQPTALDLEELVAPETSKRKIKQLVSQLDSSESLEPDTEEVRFMF
jgi:hypothetical protein